jgi:hypothetical protein
MQPNRELTPSSSGVLALTLAIARYASDSIGDSRGSATARLLWIALLARAGGRAGTVAITLPEMAALVGLGRAAALRMSKGSPGPLDRLEATGAVECVGRDRWYIAAPDDAEQPRAARIERPDERPLPGLPADVLDDPEPVTNDRPAASIAFRSPAGLPPDSGSKTGVPPESGYGGEGGAFLAAQRQGASAAQTQESSPSPSHSASDGSPAGVPYRPRDWHQAKAALAIAGAGGSGVLCERAHDAGLSPLALEQLAQYFAEVGRDVPGVNPGCIDQAIKNWWPGVDPSEPALWPSTMHAAIERQREVLERERLRATEAIANSAANEVAKARLAHLERHGVDVQQLSSRELMRALAKSDERQGPRPREPHEPGETKPP